MSTVPSRSADRTWPVFATGAVLLALLVVAFLPVISGARSFFSYDLMYEHLPIWHTVQGALREGGSPFWLDGIWMGHPFLFHQEAPLFYPLTAPLLLTGAPVHRLADLFSLLHVLLAGVSAALLVKTLTGSLPASLFGGIAWMLSARTVQGVTWPNAVAVSAYVPLLVLALLLLSRGERRAGLVLGSVAGGLTLLLARPQSVLGAAPALAATALAGVFLASRRKDYAQDVAVAAILALLLGAPSLLPSALVLPETTRQGGLSPLERDDGALHAADLDLVALPVDGIHRGPEAASYPGFAALLLFLAAFVLVFRSGSREARVLLVALALAGLAGLAFAFGEAGPYGLVSRLPLFNAFRSPVRFLASTALAVAIGSALAVSALGSTSRRGAGAAWAFATVLAVDLTLHARRAAPTVPPGVYVAPPRLVGYLLARPPDPLGVPRRYWSLGLLTPVHSLPDSLRVEAVAKADQLNNARGARFGLDAVQGAGPALRRTEQLLATRSLRAAELAGADRLVVRDPPLLPDVDRSAPPLRQAHVVRLASPLPRLILARHAVVVASGAALPALLAPGLDLRTTVLLEDGSPLPPPPPGTWLSSIRVLRREAGLLEVETEASAAAVLVAFQAWEAGWRATIDGVEAEVHRANHAFQGVRIGPGRHRVVLRYTPRGLREGGLGALLGLLGLALAFRTVKEPSGRGLESPPGLSV